MVCYRNELVTDQFEKDWKNGQLPKINCDYDKDDDYQKEIDKNYKIIESVIYMKATKLMKSHVKQLNDMKNSEQWPTVKQLIRNMNAISTGCHNYLDPKYRGKAIVLIPRSISTGKKQNFDSETGLRYKSNEVRRIHGVTQVLLWWLVSYEYLIVILGVKRRKTKRGLYYWLLVFFLNLQYELYSHLLFEIMDFVGWQFEKFPPPFIIAPMAMMRGPIVITHTNFPDTDYRCDTIGRLLKWQHKTVNDIKLVNTNVIGHPIFIPM